MKMHRLGIVIALSGSSLYACGDDSSSGDKQVTVPVVDAGGAGGIDAGGVVPAADAARPDAGSVANDAGVTSVRDAAVVDSGARDSGAPTTAPDSAVAMNPPVRDSGVPPVDSGVPSNATDPGNPASPACLACGAKLCKQESWPMAEEDLLLRECSDFGTETATNGLKAGTLKSKLCEDVHQCFQKTRCAAPGKVQQSADGGVVVPNPTWTACLSGDLPYFESFSIRKVSDFKGPCRNELLDAAETEDVMTFFGRVEDVGFAIGVATKRTVCELRVCADECYAPCKGQADGTLCTGDGNAIPPDPSNPKEPKVVASEKKQGTCQMQSCQDLVSPHYRGWMYQ
ncbi:MAG: hypothetical protein RLZZ450_802 [Pseudomonadota bacterium]|jgi:hypothetical protein